MKKINIKYTGFNSSKMNNSVLSSPISPINSPISSLHSPISPFRSPTSVLHSPVSIINVPSSTASHPTTPNEEEEAAYQNRVKLLVDSIYSPELKPKTLMTKNVMIGHSNTLFRPIKPKLSTNSDDISNFMEWDCDETDL